ncbi:P-loop containing nucleoside triphosphate hydrolase protein [Spinellus fusiger]|nr:P-loop containing nucleoside triphosphate hydrolase protein [Spinellus fusiger]
MSVNEVIGSTVERIPLDTKETVTPLRYLSSDRIKKITLSLYPSAWKVEPCLSLLNNLCSDTPMDSNALPNTILWTEKYKPNKTSLLLGNAKGATYLRDWLCEQKIVSSKIQEDIKYQHTQTITSLMDSDEDFLPTQHSIRTNKHCSPPKRPMKITSNILLIVGQHGVGKTASVYAAAKEAGYDVFEMHPGMRRSKKDIMNIVGDMTENHQVKLSKLWKKNKNKEDSSVDSSELVDEVSLSRKNDESLFGLPERGNSINTTTNTSIDKSCTSSTPSHVELKSIFSLNPSKVKQSLILLEEVDVLFEQDSGFWSGVIALSKKSKRPIIMTCNDSTSVPFKSISVHKQLLMKPPSDNHLICYLHLICLSEGHLVEPYDLGRLVKSIGPDVRQLMCTLEMLCRHESTVSLKPLNDGRKYFYKWKNLFEDWLGYHDSKTMCKCSSLLHDPPHLYQNHPNYDIMNYMKSKMKICTPCLENKYKENTDANMNLVSLHQLMDLTSAVDTWNRNIDIKN